MQHTKLFSNMRRPATVRNRNCEATFCRPHVENCLCKSNHVLCLKNFGLVFGHESHCLSSMHVLGFANAGLRDAFRDCSPATWAATAFTRRPLSSREVNLVSWITSAFDAFVKPPWCPQDRLCEVVHRHLHLRWGHSSVLPGERIYSKTLARIIARQSILNLTGIRDTLTAMQVQMSLRRSR